MLSIVCLFVCLVLQDNSILVCTQLLVIIMIAGRLSLLGFVLKPVSWLAGDSRLRHTCSLRIHLVERQSLSSICPSTIISYLNSLEASSSTSAGRFIAGPTVFSLDRNIPVTFLCPQQAKTLSSQDWAQPGRIDHPSRILITSYKQERQR